MNTEGIKERLKQTGQKALQNPDEMKHVYVKAQDFVSSNAEKKGFNKDQISNAILMVQLVKDFLKGDYRNISKTSIAVIVGALIYIITPMDLVSDIIPGIGQLDDAAVVAIAVGFVTADLICYKKWKEETDAQLMDVRKQSNINEST